MAASSSAPVLLILGSLVLGAGAGFLGGQLAAPERAADDSAAESLASVRAGERLAQLEQSVARLDDRLRALSVAPAPASAQPAPLQPAAVLDPELVQRMEQIARAFDTREAAADEGPLLSTVGAALERIREQEEQERREAREARRLEQIDERLEELRTELGLAAYQVDDMRAHFVESGAQMTAAFESMREGGGDFGDVRETLRGLREASDARLSEILSPQQLADYEAAGGMGWAGGFPRRRGFGGGDGPGG